MKQKPEQNRNSKTREWTHKRQMDKRDTRNP